MPHDSGLEDHKTGNEWAEKYSTRQKFITVGNIFVSAPHKHVR